MQKMLEKQRIKECEELGKFFRRTVSSSTTQDKLITQTQKSQKTIMDHSCSSIRIVLKG